MSVAKRIDFTQLGGFPLCQDDIAWAMDGVCGAIDAIIQEGGDGTTPFAVSGMAVSGGGNTVADGWFYYNGELIQFTGGTVTLGSGEVALVEITDSSTALTFQNGSTPVVVLVKTAALTHAATVTDATHFPVSSLVAAGVARAWANVNNINGAWETVAVGLGGYAGTFSADAVNPIRYRQPAGTKEIQVLGVTYDATPISVSVETEIFTLPAGTPAEQLFWCVGSAGAMVPIRVKTNGRLYIAGDLVSSAIVGINLNLRVVVS